MPSKNMSEKNNTSKQKHGVAIPVPQEQRLEEYWKILNTILDPDTGIGIVDLGLIYNVEIKCGAATVTMTLTSPGCPVGPDIMRRIEVEMEHYPGVKDVNVNLVWEPVWRVDMINNSLRGMFFGD